MSDFIELISVDDNCPFIISVREIKSVYSIDCGCFIVTNFRNDEGEMGVEVTDSYDEVKDKLKCLGAIL